MGYTKNDIIDFGKHKGKKIEFITINDLDYLCWLIKNHSYFKVDDEVMLLMKKKVDSLDNSNFKIKKQKEINYIIKSNIIKK